MMRKQYTITQRLVIAMRRINRSVNAMAECNMQCPGCGSSNVTGDGSSWICHNCGSQGQN